ncbi:MAG: PAS domain S-box protein [Motiliproteus sp.]
MEKQWRLSQVLSLQITMIVALPLLALALLSYIWVLPKIQADIFQQQQDIAEVIVDKTHAYLDGTEHKVKAIVDFLQQQPQSSAATVQQLLDSLVQHQQLIKSISLINAQGLVQAVGLPLERQAQRETYQGIDLSGNKHYQRIVQKRVQFWSDTYLSAINGQLAVALAVPVGTGQSLIAEVSLQQLSDYSSQHGAPSGRITMLIDRNAQLISLSNSALSGQQLNLSNMAIVSRGLKQDNAVQEFLFNDTHYVGSSVFDSSLNWLVLVAQEKEIAYQYVNLVLKTVIIASLFALLTAVLSGIYLSQRLGSRINRYSENSRQIAQGNYDLDWPPIRIDEFSRLAYHLQLMVYSIKQREQALSNSEASLRATMEKTPNVAVQWFDADGKALYWNHASEKLYQLASDQVLGKTLSQFNSNNPVYNDEMLQRFKDVAASDEAIGPYEQAETLTSGKEIVTLSTAFMIRDSELNPRFVCMDIDITEQKKTEKTLRDREQRYRALIQQSPVAVIEWDLDFNVQEWNETAEEIFGYSREEALGQHASFIVPSEKQDEVDGIMATLVANIGGYRSDNRNITASGRVITCQWYNQPIVDESGQVVTIMSSIDDVSDRKRMEAKLRSSEQKFVSLFQSSPVAMSVSYSSENPRFANCNDAWLRLFGLSRNEVIGYSLNDLELWPDSARYQQLSQQLIQDQQVDDFTVQLSHRDGSCINCLVSARFIEVGTEKMVATSYKDITQQVKAESEIHQLNQSLETRVLERTSELAQSNSELQSTLRQLERTQDELIHSEKMASLGALVGGVAHELNTPIGNSLIAATTLVEHTQQLKQQLKAGSLKRSMLDQYVEDARSGCTIVELNLHKASELVTSFKQVAVDQTSSQRRQFRLREVVGEITLTLAPSFKKTPYQLERQIPDDITLDSYPGPLGQILTNLINNAVLHGLDGKEQGQIRISAQKLDSNQVQIVVRDDGQGISKADQAKVFDPFFTSKLGQGGSGLGLNIAHNITTQILGGRIEVESEPGQGTEMILTLPLTAPEQSEGD